jgi:branched-chain amino acid transport system permease protein
MVYLVQRRCVVHKLSTKRAFIAYFLFGWLLLILADRVSELRVYQGATIAITTLAIASIILLTGYTGQVSLGHGAFLAVGAYAAALAQTYWQSPFWFTLLMAILVSAAFGFILGFAAGRLTGPYLAGTTLALAVGLPTLANQFGFLGGETGLVYDAGMPPTRFGESFTLYKWFFWIAAFVVLIAIFLLRNLLNSRFGRTWKALRSNPTAASLCGINVSSSKILAFTISAGVAGLSGALLGMISIVAPSAFPLSLSFTLITGAVLAGVTSLLGSMLGAVVLVVIPEIADVISHQLGDSEKITTNLPGFIVSVLLILTVLFSPNGPAEALRKRREAHAKH